MRKKQKQTQIGKIDASIVDNIDNIGQAIEVAKKVDEAQRAFPIEIFDNNNEEEDLRMTIKYGLAPWFQEYFGISVYPDGKVSYKKTNPSRRDNH
jgi:hypothetical protein